MRRFLLRFWCGFLGEIGARTVRRYSNHQSLESPYEHLDSVGFPKISPLHVFSFFSEIYLNFLIFGCGFSLRWMLYDPVKPRPKSQIKRIYFDLVLGFLSKSRSSFLRLSFSWSSNWSDSSVAD